MARTRIINGKKYHAIAGYSKTKVKANKKVRTARKMGQVAKITKLKLYPKGTAYQVWVRRDKRIKGKRRK